MTSKRVKAWAVVDKSGKVIYNADNEALIFRTKMLACENLEPSLCERVVRVTIIRRGE